MVSDQKACDDRMHTVCVKLCRRRARQVFPQASKRKFPCGCFHACNLVRGRPGAALGGRSLGPFGKRHMHIVCYAWCFLANSFAFAPAPLSHRGDASWGVDSHTANPPGMSTSAPTPSLAGLASSQRASSALTRCINPRPSKHVDFKPLSNSCCFCGAVCGPSSPPQHTTSQPELGF
jgi:hypothetical protein